MSHKIIYHSCIIIYYLHISFAYIIYYLYLCSYKSYIKNKLNVSQIQNKK